jgi:uncharacterized protein YggE
VRQPFSSLILAALLAPPTAVLAQTPQPQDPSVVVTTAEGVVKAAPDRAFVTITTESRAATPREAQRRNTELMTPVQEKIRSLGIPADAIRTTQYQLHQEFDFPNGRRVSKGYLAVNSVEVRLDALERLGELLEVAVSTGATSVGDIRFDVKERAKLEREALRLAVTDARARAEAAAAGAGATIARVIRIEEHGVISPPPVPVVARMAMREAQAAPPDVPVSTGLIEIRTRVSLTAAMK